MMNAECRVPNYKLQIKIGMGAEGDEKGRVKTLPYSCGSQDRITPQSAALTAPL